jgi:hypothetical protein
VSHQVQGLQTDLDFINAVQTTLVVPFTIKPTFTQLASSLLQLTQEVCQDVLPVSVALYQHAKLRLNFGQVTKLTLTLTAPVSLSEDGEISVMFWYEDC